MKSPSNVHRVKPVSGPGFGRRLVAVLAVCLALAGCDESPEVAPPAPMVLTIDAIGYYCNMIVEQHDGPKGQIFVRGQSAPYWFASVRDALTFTVLPGEPKNIAAIYVTDVGRASWDRPEPDTWIDARAAWFVIGSDRLGGMGVPELVPFGNESTAAKFASNNGGQVVRFDDLEPEDILHNHGQALAGQGATDG